VVLVDTSIWIEYIDRVNPLVEGEMDMLLRTGEVVTAGMVLAELRRGCRTPDQARRMLGRLQGLPYLEVDRENWLAAGQLVAEAAGRGYQLEIADCLLAALALRENCWILTLDQDFKRIPGVKLHPVRRV
jgi:predicted nucleic acid-binding protein